MGDGGWLVWTGIAAGSAVGGVLRYLVAEGVTAIARPPFPWGTFVVNVAGCLAIGVVAAAASPGSRADVSPVLRNALMVGVLGGFTTFSSFSLQTLVLVQSGQMGTAAANAVGSVLLCVGACWVGWSAGMWWFR